MKGKMTDEQKEKITDLLRSNLFGVIATNAASSPQSAVVTIAPTNELKIVFGSLKSARKNKNIKENQNVSMVIGWDPQVKRTLQLEGVATLLSPEEYETMKNDYLEPRKLLEGPEREYFIITPRWMRYSDLGAKEVWEVAL